MAEPQAVHAQRYDSQELTAALYDALIQALTDFQEDFPQDRDWVMLSDPEHVRRWVIEMVKAEIGRIPFTLPHPVTVVGKSVRTETQLHIKVWVHTLDFEKDPVPAHHMVTFEVNPAAVH